MDAAIDGRCDSRFASVRDAFEENFRSRGEVGAAVGVVVDGAVVADLAGGWADAAGTRPWTPDTWVNVFSVGKPVAALCVLRLVADGVVELDAPVARYWEEFAAGGKAGVTVRELLCHRAGLPAVRRPVPEDAIYDWGAMCSALAAQEPWWEPGTAHGYHVNTYGFLVGEVVRRVAGRSVGTVLRNDIAGPLGADLSIGLADAHWSRVADFLWPDGLVFEADALSEVPDDDELMVRNAYFNPPGLSGAGVVNTRRWRAAEMPSTNGHGTARGVARLYEALVAGGSVEGVRVVDPTVLAAATEEASAGEDRVLRRPSRFGLGFQLTQPERPLGPNPGAFGHFGAGGSLGFCDPDAGVAFGYVMNRLGPRWQNSLNAALIEAVYESLGAS